MAEMAHEMPCCRMRHWGEAETQSILDGANATGYKWPPSWIPPRQLILYEEGRRGTLDDGNGLISRSFWLRRSRAPASNRIRTRKSENTIEVDCAGAQEHRRSMKNHGENFSLLSTLINYA